MTSDDDVVDSLWAAVETFDEDLFDRSLARVLWDHPLDDAVRDVVLPFLAAVGDRWETGELSVGHEHFTSNLVRRRLGALALDLTLEDDAPVAVLACPPGERHDLVLLCFSLLLTRRGWRARYLGSDTPMAALAIAARTARADAVVVASTRSTRLEAHAASLRRLAEDHAVYVGGRGGTPAVAALVGARRLPADPVLAATELTGRAAPEPADGVVQR